MIKITTSKTALPNKFPEGSRLPTNNMGEKYLVSIAVGPVQDFIASARRSRDLWLGSWLLSEVSKVVAEFILEKGGELIFPTNLSGNVVNKILAIVDESALGNVDKDCRDEISKRLKEIYSDEFRKIKENLKKNGLSENDFKEEIAIDQINDLVELYWAAIPYDETQDDYKICRERVETLLKARKTTRDFNAVTWGSEAPKSSLDGQRESVIEDDLIKNNETKAQKIFGLRKKERLCGVGILKRLAEKGTDDSFFSTSHVASLPLLSTLENNAETKEAIEDYIREISRLLGEIDEIHKFVGKVPNGMESDVFGKYDGHLLFENRLRDVPFENGDLAKAKTALKNFMKTVFGKEDKKPLPYYALLQADGDRMGTIIDNQKNKEDHKKLSEALSQFAGDVKTIVEDHKGCLIYSGGDDVLALLPLHRVLDCTRKLADKFRKDLKTFDFVDDDTKEEINPTLSAGIAVVHHTEPLQESLKTMRDAEKTAKKVKGKNALAITVSKRSGADTTIKGKWRDDRNTGKSFDQRLKWFIQLHLDDALPDGVAYELKDLWLRFQDNDGKVSFHFENLLKDEARRIIERKKSESGTKPIDKKILDEFSDILSKVSFSDRGANKAEWTLGSLAEEIIVARDFARAYKQASIEEVEGIV